MPRTPPIDLGQLGTTAHYVRIAEDLRRRIVAGALRPGERLPTTRAMAQSLGVNRNTVVAAYNKLADWGYAASHVGRGTFAVLPEGSAPARPEPRSHGTERSAGRTRGSSSPWEGAFSRAFEGRRVPSFPIGIGPGRATVSLAGSFPAPELLPASEFLKSLAHATKEDRARALSYGPAQGLPALREWIAADMTRGGVPTSPEEILITNGSQQAIDLIARAFVDHSDMVLIENPVYSGAIAALESFGARLAGLALDAEGVIPGAIARAARQPAKLVYLTPSFQNPTTAVMSESRRRELLDEVSDANLLVVEDDWASGLRFEGTDPPTLRALDREGRVIYLSTFAKKLMPGLRLGWIAAARPIIERLAALKQISDSCSSPLVQSALAHFCRTGQLERHLVKARAEYRARRDSMLEALARHFPADCAWTRPQGGLFVWVQLPEGIDAEVVRSEAAAAGILTSSGDPFYLEGRGPSSLRLTYATAKPAEAQRAIRALGAIIKTQAAQPARRRNVAAAEAVPLV